VVRTVGKNKIAAIHSWQSDMLKRLSQSWMDIMQPAILGSGYTIEPQLFSENASRRFNGPAFTQNISNQDVVLLTGIAHGTPLKFTGFKGETLYHDPVPVAEAKDKIVHLLSCSTAKTLSDAFKKAQCRAFIGYTDVINIDTDQAWVTTFLTCDAQVDISLTKDKKTVAQAIQDAKGQFIKYNQQLNGTLLWADPADGGKSLPGVTADIPSRDTPTQTVQDRSLPQPSSIQPRAMQ
jgi:hypothetical protein